MRDICTRYDILFIADEVMTGWGRTGKMWGIEHWDVTPDIIATAKGMTAGYTPLSAVIARDDIWAVLEKGHSPFKAGHTLNANAVSCAGAIAVINYILKHSLVENSCERGEQALQGLRALMAKHPIVGDVRGQGLMFGFELVRDRETKKPFESQQHASGLFEQAALKRGLVAYPCTGTVDGVLGDMVLLAPPLVISKAQINDVLSIVDESLADAEKELGVA
jgi:adenosylmethionine-8-amino-7-oxononanoate aminotransferase